MPVQKSKKTTSVQWIIFKIPNGESMQKTHQLIRANYYIRVEERLQDLNELIKPLATRCLNGHLVSGLFTEDSLTQR